MSQICSAYAQNNFGSCVIKQVVKEWWRKAASQGGGGFFTEDSVMWNRSVWNIAVGSSSLAIIPLLTIEWSLSLHTPQQRLPVLFNPSPNQWHIHWMPVGHGFPLRKSKMVFKNAALAPSWAENHIQTRSTMHLIHIRQAPQSTVYLQLPQSAADVQLPE